MVYRIYDGGASDYTHWHIIGINVTRSHYQIKLSIKTLISIASLIICNLVVCVIVIQFKSRIGKAPFNLVGCCYECNNMI